MTEPIGPQRAGVTSVELDGRFCLFAPATDSVVVLNESASSVWSLIDGRRTEQDLVQELAQRFGIPEAALRDDVHAAVQSFDRAGLIERRD